MSEFRAIIHNSKGFPTSDGAGVKLTRVFGSPNFTIVDPFLMLDEFHSDNPKDYIAGFPPHPHRGIETVTYLLHGKMRHEDSTGGRGLIETGGVQWMKTGSGIIHSEMPEQKDGLIHGFQLWINIPSTHKMSSPEYEDIPGSKIETVELKEGISVKIISGKIGETKGPGKNGLVDPQYFHFKMNQGAELDFDLLDSYNYFTYTITGSGFFDKNESKEIPQKMLSVFSPQGSKIHIKANSDNFEFLLIGGKPIIEPIAWHGPIVMNSEQELLTAFEELRTGRFIR